MPKKCTAVGLYLKRKDPVGPRGDSNARNEPIQSERCIKASSCMKDHETGRSHQLTHGIFSSTRDKERQQYRQRRPENDDENSCGLAVS